MGNLLSCRQLIDCNKAQFKSLSTKRNSPKTTQVEPQVKPQVKPHFTFIVCPINTTGHINACLGAVSKLVERGHQVVFVVEESWKGKLLKYGVEESCYVAPLAGTDTADALVDMEQFGLLSPKEKAVESLRSFERSCVRKEWETYNSAISCAIYNYRAHCVITDENGLMPGIRFGNLPWIRLLSRNPTFYFLDPEMPPGGSGLPYNDRSQWHDFDSVRQENIQSKAFNDFVKAMGSNRYPEDYKTPDTQLLTVYACPEEWNYPPLQSRPNCFNLEVFNKQAGSINGSLLNVVLSQFLKNSLNGKYSGKLIYLFMGSMGSRDLSLMRRLLGVFAKTNHKYIVSKGPRHAEIELPANCWGEEYLPQTAMLPLVDLVITHGGNNTVTESFAQGKPMLVLPLFGDQYDNAQRLHETGYGMKLDPYRFTDTELVTAIDQLLNDETLKNKAESASKRIQETDQHEAFAEYVEKKIEHHQATTYHLGPRFFVFHVY